MDAQARYLVIPLQLQHRRNHHTAFEPHQTRPTVGVMAQRLAPSLKDGILGQSRFRDSRDAVLLQLRGLLKHAWWPSDDGLRITECSNHPSLHCAAVLRSEAGQLIG